MNNPDFLGAGIKFPPQLTNRAGSETILAYAEGETSIRDSIILILSTYKGERLMRPDFGCRLRDYVFEANNTTTHTRLAHEAEEALKQFEPRIKIESVDVSSDPEDLRRLGIDITYRIRSNNTRHNLVFPFFLERE